MNRSEILGNGSSFESRYVRDYAELAELVEHYRGVGLKVVLNSGSYDMQHRGHKRFLEKAKTHGDILIVGVESDDKIRQRKKRRVAVSEEERLEDLTHLRHVDIVTLKHADEPRWHLIKSIKPDVLVTVALEELGPNGELVPESYTFEEIEELKQWCGEVVVIERQAPVSTTARIRQMMIDGAAMFKRRVAAALDVAFEEFISGEPAEEDDAA